MSVDNINQQQQLRTREEYKKAKLEAEQRVKSEQKQDKEAVDAVPRHFMRVRLIPIWLRLVLLVVLVFFSLVAGSAVGYGMLGGGAMADVFKVSTWTHIIDLVNKK